MTRHKFEGIEIARVLSALAVILIHTRPFFEMGQYSKLAWHLSMVIDATCRFAVPFFFITAGYFFYESCQKKPVPSCLLKSWKKLFPLLLIWSLVYAVLPEDFLFRTFERGVYESLWVGASKRFIQTLDFFKKDTATFLLESSAVHLWFLISLGMALGMAALFIRLKRYGLFILTGVVFYALGLLTKAYRFTQIGIDIPYFDNGRDGPFFATLFVSLGVGLAQAKTRISAKTAWLLASGGFLLSIAEDFFIAFQTQPEQVQDFSFGTIPFAIGVFALAVLAEPRGWLKKISNLGRYTLGIYLCHLVFFEMLKRFYVYFGGISWQFIFPAGIFSLSLIFTVIISKVPALCHIAGFSNPDRGAGKGS